MPGKLKKSKPNKSALSVSEGVAQPASLNRCAIDRLKQARQKTISATELLDGILAGNMSMLSRGITLVESALPQHVEQAQKLLAACLPYSGKALRLGITGVPGAGKSTFIEAFGMHIIRQGGKLAVLAVDPSSERSGGSILGDKTRMEELAGRTEAYIRPSPSGGTLGGVARKTRESIILCEAAGFDHILIETVGVGQSETAVHSMVDFFLLLMLAGAGDELQGIKRGIMEMADAIVINKADGHNVQRARRAQAEYANALHLFPPAESGWTPEVHTCSSLYNTGITEIRDMLQRYIELVEENGYRTRQRQQQSRYWMYETVREGIYDLVFRNGEMAGELKHLEAEIAAGRLTSHMAAEAILNKYKKFS
ncbi:MAG: methylmalonyl Co-A mutase-associated GTPase MeaB [Bacteroidetes bacterium]|nr:MAG: methylmalonyl Co-A mutase-associated GTPase MeaB [Bacteroidota bacterium]